MECWLYESKLYDSRSVAKYVAMCVRDDQLLSGAREPIVHVFKTRRGKYGVKYQV
ncbi:hypothetical protein [Effusibacillus dendaii]|uniref:Uncharacterized protein n=1 Tax=Effusibacillus dendaii TaxID=2743772 RepID=A0A7I8DCY2_9BACL|nr:hypothetical protein [Effusibacillus dendaii]BCJ85761.1 hypothetical protein skT53_07460 [Effusibacillus dendaii]